MKRARKLLSVIAAVSIFVVSFLSGCSSKENIAKKDEGKVITAKDTASAIYKLALQEEDKEAKEIGFTDTEIKTLKDKQKSASIMSYRKIFASMGISLSQPDAEALYKAEMKALKKLSFTIAIEDEKGKNCNVVIKTDTIELSGAFEKAIETTTEKVTKSEITDKQQIAETLLEEVKNGLAAIEPGKGRKEIVAAFTLKEVETNNGNVKKWFPKNSTKFGSDLAQAVKR